LTASARRFRDLDLNPRALCARSFRRRLWLARASDGAFVDCAAGEDGCVPSLLPAPSPSAHSAQQVVGLFIMMINGCDPSIPRHSPLTGTGTYNSPLVTRSPLFRVTQGSACPIGSETSEWRLPWWAPLLPPMPNPGQRKSERVRSIFVFNDVSDHNVYPTYLMTQSCWVIGDEFYFT